MEQGIVTPVRRWIAIAVMAIALGLSLSSSSASEAGQGRTYKVQGTVIAVTLNQTPQLIVVNTPLSPKNHMTVGATVNAQTRILRGPKRVALQTIKVGETVWLTYVKTSEGLFARTIQAKA
jgi:hypothetical protein